MNINEQMIAFIEKSPTAFHAVKTIVEELETKGFKELKEKDTWNLEKNGKYYVTRNQSGVLAFVLPENVDALSFHMVASHSDSPTFKLKPKTVMEQEGHYVKLNVEGYGGMIMNTWMDRPLSVAGRVIVKTDSGLEARLVNIDKDFCMIPNMSIHQNRNANSDMKYNPQVDMLPVVGYGKDEGKFMQEIAKSASCEVEQILSTDLYLYNRQKGVIWGDDNYVSIGHLDDLQCAFTSLVSFMEASTKEHVNVYCCFDNEEVGSGTRQGAHSNFLSDTLSRICKAFNQDVEVCLAGSLLVSADNAHSVHPNHPELADPTNRVHMNEGVVIKYNASQSYTTDALSSAIFMEACKRAEVPYQPFTNRSDTRGGATLGMINITHVSVPTVDIGAAQWAMHSAYETAGCKDTEYLVKSMKEFYEMEFVIDNMQVTFK